MCCSIYGTHTFILGALDFNQKLEEGNTLCEQSFAAHLKQCFQEEETNSPKSPDFFSDVLSPSVYNQAVNNEDNNVANPQEVVEPKTEIQWLSGKIVKGSITDFVSTAGMISKLYNIPTWSVLQYLALKLLS